MDTCIYVCVYVSCSIISDPWWPINCSPPGSSVKRIFQTRILEWVAILYSRRSSGSGVKPWSPALQADVYIYIYTHTHTHTHNIYTHTHHSLPTSYQASTHIYTHTYIYMYIHLSKFIDCTTQRVSLNVNYWTLGEHDVNIGPSIVTTVPLWWGMLIMGEAMHLWSQEVYGEPLYLPLNFAVNLKLLFKSKEYIYIYIYKELQTITKWALSQECWFNNTDLTSENKLM